MAIAARQGVATGARRQATFAERVRRHGVRSVVMVVGLAFFTVWTLFPFLWIILTAVKPNRELYTPDAAIWPIAPTGIHFEQILYKTNFPTYFRNSMIVAIATTFISMVIGVLAAYALTRLTFQGRTIVARSVIFTYLIPGSLLFIPVFQLANSLQLTNRLEGLIVVYLIGNVPFCTWLAISYFNTIPGELEDAALVDGASRLQSLVRVIVPLALPALAVIALYAFTHSWNEFLFALLLIGRDTQKTIPAGLAGLINGDVYQWGALMACSLLASVPPILIYIAAQKWVVSGLAGGAVKG